MKNILPLIILCLVIGGECLLSGCRKKTEVDKVQIEKEKIRFDTIFNNETNETTILLSIKYNLERDKVANILDEYSMMVHGFSWNLGRYTNDEVVDVSVAIDKLSKQYNVPKETIVNILLTLKGFKD